MPISNESNSLQMLTTQMHVLLVLTVSREKFQKHYLDLEPAQREEVEGLVGGMIRHYWKHYDPSNLLGMVAPSTPGSVQ